LDMSFEVANKLKSSPLGFLANGWNLVKLKDVTTKIGSGATPRGGSSVYLSSRKNYALIRSQHVFDRRFDSRGLVFITDEHAAELQKVAVQPRDVLLNITGDGITFGRACIVPKDVLPACVNQHVSIIRTDPKVCLPEYLLCYLTHPVSRAILSHLMLEEAVELLQKGISNPLRFRFHRLIAEGDRPHSRHPRRQNRTQPADEPHAGSDRPRPLQILVYRLRSRPCQDGWTTTRRHGC
jgi:hypothetical protein